MGHRGNTQSGMRTLSGVLGAHFCFIFSLSFLTSIFHRIFLNSMCFARTAALHGGNEKQKVNASRFFLQQSLHHVEKYRPRAKKLPT